MKKQVKNQVDRAARALITTILSLSGRRNRQAVHATKIQDSLELDEIAFIGRTNGLGFVGHVELQVTPKDFRIQLDKHTICPEQYFNVEEFVGWAEHSVLQDVRLIEEQRDILLAKDKQTNLFEKKVNHD